MTENVLKFALVVVMIGAVSIILIDRLLPAQQEVATEDAAPKQQPANAAALRTAPPPADPLPGRAIRIKAGANGHFFLNAQVNGANLPFLVDTGASTVALSHEAATRARIHLTSSDFTIPVNTANGTIRAAPVTLKNMRYQNIRLNNVRALVLPKGALAGNSLLGNSFLSRLRSFKIEKGTLILQP